MRCRDSWNRWARPVGTRLPNTSSRAVTPGSLVTRRSDQVREGVTGWVTDQPGRPHARLVTPLLTNLTADQRRIVALCEVPRKQAFLMQETGLSHRTFFQKQAFGAARPGWPDPCDAAGRAAPPGPGVRGDRCRARAPERLAVRCRPHGRCMSNASPRVGHSSSEVGHSYSGWRESPSPIDSIDALSSSGRADRLSGCIAPAGDGWPVVLDSAAVTAAR